MAAALVGLAIVLACNAVGWIIATLRGYTPVREAIYTNLAFALSVGILVGLVFYA